MPIYEYQCEKCGVTKEVMQKMDDLPLKTCEECGGNFKKIVSLNSFRLKGGGWYAEGYQKDKEKKDKPAE
ncbi:hypothetical protein A2303_06955 [Candidatus Falkowbacteria bacterium RIFOXYB2_FULL_47_14]|uniref:Putative regulatory protein FmdB zinc ribbon domain-containing protein n=1 Tax=Candidatus Falkowbacteria bacterium RIFOXYA2_FULL_47_19 TaxID=1797994 RepID=A0A1F5SGH0_9BACT|nr:MAG: hypothetical protein A2227_00700 [Candidatus Falkowbacteria bacterium RIFOXYA2_FULL_47_19]OGF35481.1 MAG: hypothetical protein A2468_05570 [Candidatus Falkowbacteria bacterium RIFOXYC2_FULL_46_15]OGF43609.1 MAG: hypothetical protein A2303_06955 [Candidatus Falkowbacteria bacterium RIFOXYB2_FULL_47_14]